MSTSGRIRSQSASAGDRPCRGSSNLCRGDVSKEIRGPAEKGTALPKTSPNAIKTVQSSLRTTRRSTTGSISYTGGTESTTPSPLMLDFSSCEEDIFSTDGGSPGSLSEASRDKHVAAREAAAIADGAKEEPVASKAEPLGVKDPFLRDKDVFAASAAATRDVGERLGRCGAARWARVWRRRRRGVIDGQKIGRRRPNLRVTESFPAGARRSNPLGSVGRPSGSLAASSPHLQGSEISSAAHRLQEKTARMPAAPPSRSTAIRPLPHAYLAPPCPSARPTLRSALARCPLPTFRG